MRNVLPLIYSVHFVTCRPAEFGETEESKSEGMIPSDMLPPSDSESDSDTNGDLAIANPNRPLISYDHDDDDSSEDEDESFMDDKSSDNEQDEKHYVG